MALEWTAGNSNIFIRPMCFSQPGYIHDGHTHNFDHTAIVFNNTIRAEAEFPDGRKVEQDFTGPTHFLVDANVKHRLQNIAPTLAEVIAVVDAMTPDEMRAELIRLKTAPTQAWCVYAHRDPQGEVTERNIGWGKSYV